eukprot:SAG31_NODE_38492_length_295_cov_2.775510_1_plen_31_part_01
MSQDVFEGLHEARPSGGGPGVTSHPSRPSPI